MYCKALQIFVTLYFNFDVEIRLCSIPFGCLLLMLSMTVDMCLHVRHVIARLLLLLDEKFSCEQLTFVNFFFGIDYTAVFTRLVNIGVHVIVVFYL